RVRAPRIVAGRDKLNRSNRNPTCGCFENKWPSQSWGGGLVRRAPRGRAFNLEPARIDLVAAGGEELIEILATDADAGYGSARGRKNAVDAAGLVAYLNA